MSINMNENIEYKYSELKALQDIAKYIENTYGEHYAQNKYQATEFIIDGGHGIGFTVGNILKYAQRYGHKGTPDDWRKDLMKVIHYSIIALHVHDTNHQKSSDHQYGISEEDTDLIAEAQERLTKQAKLKKETQARAMAMAEFLINGTLDSMIRETQNPL